MKKGENLEIKVSTLQGSALRSHFDFMVMLPQLCRLRNVFGYMGTVPKTLLIFSHLLLTTSFISVIQMKT